MARSEQSPEVEIDENQSRTVEKHSRLRTFWLDWRGFFAFIAIMLVFRSAIADWNQVPSGSMKPSILIGDRILVDKLAYDLRVPFTLTRITAWSDPKRGDVVTFPNPVDERLFVKRVIGLPGDIVELRRNELIVNGVPATYSPLSSEEIAEIEIPNKSQYRFLHESWGDMNHVMMLIPSRHMSRYQSFGPIKVPQGNYLMLGDNRDNSGDFRKIGWVERERILGRAHAIAFSLDYDHYYSPRGDRFFKDLN